MHHSSRTTHRVKLIPAFLGKRQVLFINFKQNLFKNFFFTGGNVLCGMN